MTQATAEELLAQQALHDRIVRTTRERNYVTSIITNRLHAAAIPAIGAMTREKFAEVALMAFDEVKRIQDIDVHEALTKAFPAAQPAEDP